MNKDVVHLRMPSAPQAVRVHVPTGSGGGHPTVRRLLQWRDAAQDQAQARRAVEACAAAIAARLSELRQQVEVRLDEVAALVTDLGLAVAREIVADAIARGGIDPLPIVQRCLRDAVTHGDEAAITLHLTATDRERLAAAAELQQVRVVVDPALSPGTVRVQTSAGSLAYDPEEVLRRVSDELRRELSACR